MPTQWIGKMGTGRTQALQRAGEDIGGIFEDKRKRDLALIEKALAVAPMLNPQQHQALVNTYGEKMRNYGYDPSMLYGDYREQGEPTARQETTELIPQQGRLNLQQTQGAIDASAEALLSAKRKGRYEEEDRPMDIKTGEQKYRKGEQDLKAGGYDLTRAKTMTDLIEQAALRLKGKPVSGISAGAISYEAPFRGFPPSGATTDNWRYLGVNADGNIVTQNTKTDEIHVNKDVNIALKKKELTQSEIKNQASALTSLLAQLPKTELADNVTMLFQNPEIPAAVKAIVRGDLNVLSTATPTYESGFFGNIGNVFSIGPEDAGKLRRILPTLKTQRDWLRVMEGRTANTIRKKIGEDAYRKLVEIGLSRGYIKK